MPVKRLPPLIDVKKTAKIKHRSPSMNSSWFNIDDHINHDSKNFVKHLNTGKFDSFF